MCFILTKTSSLTPHMKEAICHESQDAEVHRPTVQAFIILVSAACVGLALRGSIHIRGSLMSIAEVDSQPWVPGTILRYRLRVPQSRAKVTTCIWF